MNMAKTGFVYLFISLFCVLFGAVYECFSHQVYSYFMLYAFVFPLACGVLPFLGLAFLKWPIPGKISCNLYHSGIAALTIGSLFKGILEIYGTTNRLVLVYWVVGFVFLFGGLISYWLGIGHIVKNHS
jgi:hypothetical protein